MRQINIESMLNIAIKKTSSNAIRATASRNGEEVARSRKRVSKVKTDAVDDTVDRGDKNKRHLRHFRNKENSEAETSISTKKDFPESVDIGSTRRRGRTTGQGRSSNGNSKDDCRLKQYWFSPNMRSYQKYAQLIDRYADELACNLKDEKFVNDLVANDASITDEGLRLNDHAQFLALLCKACHLNRSVISAKAIQRSIDIYEKSNKRWISNFANDLNLCSYDDAPPVLVQISVSKKIVNDTHPSSYFSQSSTSGIGGERGCCSFDKYDCFDENYLGLNDVADSFRTTSSKNGDRKKNLTGRTIATTNRSQQGFDNFVQKNCIKPIKLEFYSLLFEKTKILSSALSPVTSMDVYSLEIRKLKKIKRTSVYYKRIYAMHVVIFLICREITLTKKTIKVRLLINRHISFLFRVKTTPLIKLLLDKRIVFDFL